MNKVSCRKPYFKTILVLEGPPLSEMEMKKVFIALKQFLRGLSQLVIMVSMLDFNDTQLITSNIYDNKSLQFHPHDSSLDQLFFDKVINQKNFGIRVNFRNPPFTYEKNGVIQGVIKKYTPVLCQSMNTTCRITDRDKDFNYFLTLSYFGDQLIVPKFAFEFSYPYNFHHYCILAPKAEQLSSLWSMAHALERSLMICIPVFFALCGFYWYYIVKGTPDRKSFYDIYFLLFEMLITNGTHIRLQSKTERLFCISFIILSFYLVFGYTCKLTALLVAPQYDRDINTWHDIVAKDFFVIYSSSVGHVVMPILMQKERKYMKENIFKNNVFLDRFPPNRFGVFLNSSLDTRLTQVVDCNIAEIFIKSKENFVDGVAQYHKMAEKIDLIFKLFFSTVRCPAMIHVNKLNARLMESGIWKQWEDEEHSAIVLKAGQVTGESTDSLQTQTLLEFWKVLIVGYLICLLVFIGEILWFYSSFQKVKAFGVKVFALF